MIIYLIGFGRVDGKVLREEPIGNKVNVLLDFIEARRGCNGMREEYCQQKGGVKRRGKVEDYLSH